MTQLRVGQYVVDHLLGEGAFGWVYCCSDGTRRVAVKVLKVTLEGKRLLELDAPGLIGHPGIVKVLEALPDENAFVMEFVPGQTLSQWLRTDLDGIRSHFLSIALELTDALAAAHRRQILHRDIKPANILMAAPDKPRLADFGVARLLGESGVAITRAGTPLYMAPEIHRGEPYDAAADIYSLGTLFYEIWAGRPPFHSTSPATLMLAKIQGDHEPADAVNPATPRWLSDMIDRMLSVDPPRPSAEQLRVELLTQQWINDGRRLEAIDDFALAVGSIYSAKNSSRGPVILLAHFLTELEGIVGGVRDLRSAYGRSRAQESLPRAFAWLAALITSLNFRISQVVDLKFPGSCPYCDAAPCECSADESALERNRRMREKIIARSSTVPSPSQHSFDYYQKMFRTIYHERNLAAGIDSVCVNALAAVAQFTDAFLRVRSLKEVNAVDIIPVELADNVAWFMALTNMISDAGDLDFVATFQQMYPGRCPKCQAPVCDCPDVEAELRLINWRDFK